MLTEQQLSEIREELDNCNDPLYFFDDDPDGLSSFLLLYRYKKEGHGVPVKAAPALDKRFLNKVENYKPDKIFILDIPKVSEDFIEEIDVPIIWIDHHPPVEARKVKYFNPRIKNKDANYSVSRICYDVTANENDMWIAAVGAIGDWQIPDFFDKFKKKYPQLIEEKTKTPEEALFSSELGKIIKTFAFILKGKTAEVLKCIKILTRIESPDELLQETSARGRYISKRVKKVKEDYDELLSKANENVSKDNLLFFIYSENRNSFTKELSNELLYLYPEKVIMVGREKSGEVKLSIRAMHKILPKIIEKALVGVDGYGGGHEHACGANIKAIDFEKFLDNFKKAL